MLVGCSQNKTENKPVPKDPAPQVKQSDDSSSKIMRNTMPHFTTNLTQ